MADQIQEAGPSTATTTISNAISQISLRDSSTPIDTAPAPNGKSKSRKSRPKEPKPKPTPAPKAPKPVPQPIESFDNPAEGEEETVHEIYESIAPHFAQTRHKPWPLITTFLNSLPPNSIGLDSGAGNGKYLPTAAMAGHTMIALDRSLGLLEHAKEQEGGLDIVRGDLGCRGWRGGVFDFTISVAAIHHLSTPTRRRQAVQALLPALKLNSQAPYSRFFIYVWAYEQGDLSKRRMGVKATSTSASASAGASAGAETEGPGNIGGEGRDGRDVGDSVREEENSGEKIQDVLVPWVLRSKPKSKPKPKPKPQSNPKTKLQPRPYSESKSRTAAQLDDLVADDDRIRQEAAEEVGGVGTLEQEEQEKEEEEEEEEEEEKEKVFNRYYHLFIEGELRDLIYEAGKEEGYRILPSIPSTTSDSVETTRSQGSSESTATDGIGKWLRIRGEGWEADNWWVEAEIGVGHGQ